MVSIRAAAFVLGLLLWWACATGPEVDAAGLISRPTDGGGETWHHGTSAHPFTGVAIARLPDGQSQARASFLQGQRHGLETRWHANGRRERQQHWRHGQLHGSHIHWDDGGNKLWHTAYDDGVPVRAQSWHAGGTVQSDIRYREGRVISRQEWDANGSQRQLPGFLPNGTPRH